MVMNLGVDSGHRIPERCQRACRLTGTAAHLKHRRPSFHAGDGDEIREQLVRVRRPHPAGSDPLAVRCERGLDLGFFEKRGRGAALDRPEPTWPGQQAQPRLLRVVRRLNLAAGDNRRRRCAPLSDVKHLIGHGGR
jgi:hypothetical protein